MKIVVLDSIPLNPGDLDWGPLAVYGELVTHQRTAPDETAARMADADIVFTNKVVVGEAEIASASKLKMIGVLATGYDNVDVQAAASRGIPVCNAPGYSTDSVAQLTIALLLELCHHAAAHDQAVRAGVWQERQAFCFWEHPLVELAGKRHLIVGLGAIGKRVAAISSALGMEIKAAQFPGRKGSRGKIGRLKLEEGFRTADVISLHCPLTDETKALIDPQRLSWMKPSAFIINTGRGALVDENAVAIALKERYIAGFATDVLSSEPPSPNNPLLDAPNCIITPHLAWATLESRQRLLDISIANVAGFLEDEPQNVVS